jgi:hypothetical protein
MSLAIVPFIHSTIPDINSQLSDGVVYFVAVLVANRFRLIGRLVNCFFPWIVIYFFFFGETCNNLDADCSAVLCVVIMAAWCFLKMQKIKRM